jgi:ABC-type antimicrobial peptide transport system permease subunit
MNALLSASTPAETDSRSVSVQPLSIQLRADRKIGLLVLFGAMCCVLLIACANISSLLLARGTAREHEFAIRAALGAGRTRLLRQVLAESGLLALAGGIVGLLTAPTGIRLLQVYAPEGIPRMGDASLNLSVLAFTGGISIVTALLFGLVPAWKLSRSDPQESLRTAGKGTSSGGLARACSFVVCMRSTQ